METIEVVLKGQTPLMVKSDQTVDPFNKYTMQIAEITKKRNKKTEADIRLLRRIEWEAGLYYEKEIGPYLPGWNIVRSIQDGAKMNRGGKSIIRGVSVAELKVPILYSGPRTLDAMYDSGRFVDVRRCVAKGGGGATMRARPKFDEWSLNVTVEYDERVISRADLLSAINDAGRFAGLGEYRPSSPKGGQFGRYAVEKINGKAVKQAA